MKREVDNLCLNKVNITVYGIKYHFEILSWRETIVNVSDNQKHKNKEIQNKTEWRKEKDSKDNVTFKNK